MKAKTLKQCLEEHDDVVALFGLKSINDPAETSYQLGWSIVPMKMAARYLGDRSIYSAVFDAQETGDQPYQNVTVTVPVDSPPMVVQGDREDWQHIFSVEIW